MEGHSQAWIRQKKTKQKTFNATCWMKGKGMSALIFYMPLNPAYVLSDTTLRLKPFSGTTEMSQIFCLSLTWIKASQ